MFVFSNEMRKVAAVERKHAASFLVLVTLRLPRVSRQQQQQQMRTQQEGGNPSNWFLDWMLALSWISHAELIPVRATILITTTPLINRRPLHSTVQSKLYSFLQRVPLLILRYLLQSQCCQGMSDHTWQGILEVKVKVHISGMKSSQRAVRRSCCSRCVCFIMHYCLRVLVL